ncbi:DUF4168 domain-containing protein [Salinisphaera hydrothermalis]|uniref:DUF4168 domain-containing protein n=1 Tax=Salinisphaera hydrothermalis (strain C41B8) TaxID=1304275 RepID=A0A084IQK2_SALHC|nr:DUF4168 domain-containing protein [Salinisphaera hydrothermalis]KEZ78986.1 hypothetical protein C41B8_02612 [Salinisphaera hydrothermalis C41B8]
MQFIKSRTAIAFVLGATTLFALPALAADNPSAAASASTKAKSADPFTDKQLKQFVKAQANVQAVIKKWDDKVAKADDKKAAQKKENKAMVQAVKDSGLTPKQYNRIAQQAQKDPELTKRIQSFMTPQ